MTYCTKCGKPTNNGIMCEDCFVSDSPWLLAMKAKEDDLVEQIEQLKAKNAELKSSLTHVNEELKTRIRRAEKAVYIAARDEIEALYNVKTMDKREYAEQIEAYMFDLFCRADRELAEEGKDD